MSKLLETYNRIALAVGMAINPETSAWEMPYGDEVVPVSVTIARGDTTETLPLVMPSKEVLKKEEDGLTVKFHPFAESPFAAQSEVLNKLIMLAGGRVCTAVQGLVQVVIDLSLNYEQHGNYTNNTMRVISDMPSVKTDKKRQKIFQYAEKVAQAHNGIRGPHTVLRFNLRRNVAVGEEQYLRYASLSTPVLDSDRETMRIFGVKAPSVLAFETVLGAYKAILGEDDYGYGVKSQTAPHFMAFMGSFGQVAKQINKVAKQLGKHARKEYRIDTSWENIFEEADVLVKELNIPFEGNVGSLSNKAEEARIAEGASAPKAAAVNVELKRAEPTVGSKITDVHGASAVVAEVVEDKPAPATPSTVVASPFRKPLVDPMLQAATGNTVAKASRPSFRKGVTQTQPTSTTKVESAVKKQQVTVEQPVRSQPQSQVQRTSSSAVTIEHRVHKTHLHDSLNQPLYLANGQPWMVTEEEKPKELFTVMTSPDGRPIYSGDKPRLEGISRQELDQLLYQNNMRGGQPNYGQPQQPQMGHPGNPMAALMQPQYPQQQQPRYDNNGMTAHPLARPQAPQQQYGQPQYGQPQYGQPQQPQYGHPGNPAAYPPQQSLGTGYLHG